jgi:pre-mRNA-splicing factor ATP-dependent RNA helicase DHX38/PRP16
METQMRQAQEEIERKKEERAQQDLLIPKQEILTPGSTPRRANSRIGL